MEYYDWNKQHELATKQVGKFSVYVNNGLNFDVKDEHIWAFVVEELQKIFGVKTKEYYDYVGNVLHGGLFFFESEEEAFQFYEIFTKELTDSSAIYSCVYSPESGCLTENT